MKSEIRFQNGKVIVETKNAQTGQVILTKEFSTVSEAENWMQNLTIDKVLAEITQ